jgi:hypothetical protein
MRSVWSFLFIVVGIILIPPIWFITAGRGASATSRRGLRETRAEIDRGRQRLLSDMLIRQDNAAEIAAADVEAPPPPTTGPVPVSPSPVVRLTPPPPNTSDAAPPPQKKRRVKATTVATGLLPATPNATPNTTSANPDTTAPQQQPLQPLPAATPNTTAPGQQHAESYGAFNP